MPIIRLVTFCLALFFPVAVHAVAIYVNSSQVLVRQEKFDASDADAKNWRLVKSGETVILNMSEFKDLIYSTIEKVKEDGNPLVTNYASGLLVTTRGVQDPDFSINGTRDREISIQVELRNTDGRDKVYVSDKKFSLADNEGNEISIIPCHARTRKSTSPFIMPGEQISTAVCAEIPGGMDPRRLMIRFDDGNEEGKWMRLRAPINSAK